MAGAARRERLVGAAAQLFIAHGYGATSLRDLADAGGCSKAALYRLFASKDDLLAALAEPFIGEVESVLASVSLDLDQEADRIEVIQAYLVTLCAHRDVAKVVLTDSGVRPTAVGQRVLEQQRSLVARLTGPRAPLRRQVRARCAVAISHLIVGELSSVPVHRLRPPLLDAAIEMLVIDQPVPSRAVREGHS